MKTEFTSFGELLVRLTTTLGLTIDRMPDLTPFIGGAEANVAVGLARLGHKTQVISILPDNDLGLAALSELKRNGVITDNIQTTEGRMGLYFLTPGAIHRPSEIIYDRANSAFANFDFSQVNWQEALKGTQWLHISGVTAALGMNVFNAAKDAMKAAKALGIKISYDGNYRPKLWETWSKDAPKLILELMEYADLMFAGHRDFELVFGQKFDGDGDIKETNAAEFAFKKLPNLKRIANTPRTQISASVNILRGLMLTRDGHYSTKEYEIDGIVDRIGGGDAFASGLMHGVLSGLDDESSLKLGIASCCLKHAQPGDFCLATKAQLDNFLSDGGFDVKR